MTHFGGSYSDIVVLVDPGVLEQAPSIKMNTTNPKFIKNLFPLIILSPPLKELPKKITFYSISICVC